MEHEMSLDMLGSAVVSSGEDFPFFSIVSTHYFCAQG